MDKAKDINALKHIYDRGRVSKNTLYDVKSILYELNP